MERCQLVVDRLQAIITHNGESTVQSRIKDLEQYVNRCFQEAEVAEFDTVPFSSQPIQSQKSGSRVYLCPYSDPRKMRL